MPASGIHEPDPPPTWLVRYEKRRGVSHGTILNWVNEAERAERRR